MRPIRSHEGVEEDMQISTEKMIKTSPGAAGRDTSSLAKCIDACFECAQTCIACADACLAEKSVDALRLCIRLNLDCADVCETTGHLLSRVSQGPSPTVAQALVQACALACAECAAECEKHAKTMNMEHCRICADACRRCEAACRAMVAS